MATGIQAKENVLSQIQHKLRMELDAAESENMDSMGSIDVKEDVVDHTASDGEDTARAPVDRSANHHHATRSRKKGQPTKYIPDDVYTCPTCTKQFEYTSQYEQHCCFIINDSVALSSALSPDDDQSHVDNDDNSIDNSSGHNLLSENTKRFDKLMEPLQTD